MWEIIDNNGTIHSGSEDEMTLAFDIMTNSDDYPKKKVKEWRYDWQGDLRLIQVHSVYR